MEIKYIRKPISRRSVKERPAPTRAPARHLESELQRACVQWFRLQYPKHALLLFAVPNGGGRSRVEAAIMKGEGVVAGVSDLILLEARGQYGALCIEMKTDSKKSRQRKGQAEWQAATEAAGNLYVVCRTFEEFRARVDDYMLLPPRKIIVTERTKTAKLREIPLITNDLSGRRYEVCGFTEKTVITTED